MAQQQAEKEKIDTSIIKSFTGASLEQVKAFAVGTFTHLMTEEEIHQMVEKAKEITIKDPENCTPEELKDAEDALKALKKLRTSTEAHRKKIGRASLDLTKAINDEAKRLKSITEPEEERLKTEVEAVKKVEEQRAFARLQERKKKIREVGASVRFENETMIIKDLIETEESIQELTDEAFEELLESVKEQQDRIDAEEKERQELIALRAEARLPKLAALYSAVQNENGSVTLGKLTLDAQMVGTLDAVQWETTLNNAIKFADDKKAADIAAASEAAAKAEEEAKAEQEAKQEETTSAEAGEPVKAEEDQEQVEGLEDLPKSPIMRSFAITNEIMKFGTGQEFDPVLDFMNKYAPIEEGESVTYTHEQFCGLIGNVFEYVHDLEIETLKD